jgi:chorismate--pyruvate lyase
MKDLFGKHAFEPVWQPSYRLLTRQLPVELRPWLLDDSSLTQRLTEACNGQFRVEVLSQGWERPMLSEARALKVPATRLALVRQVRLHCNDTPWVFARTIIPVSTLRGRQRRLAHLGSRPLGAVLFADPHMQRSPLEIVKIREGQRLFHRAIGSNSTVCREIWGRRSVFYLNQRPLLVSEIFLPDLPADNFPGHQP